MITMRESLMKATFKLAACALVVTASLQLAHAQ